MLQKGISLPAAAAARVNQLQARKHFMLHFFDVSDEYGPNWLKWAREMGLVELQAKSGQGKCSCPMIGVARNPQSAHDH